MIKTLAQTAALATMMIGMATMCCLAAGAGLLQQWSLTIAFASTALLMAEGVVDITGRI